MGGGTNNNTNFIEMKKNIMITAVIMMTINVTMHTVTGHIKDILVTISILDTEKPPTKKTVTTGITFIEVTSMNTRAIGNPGNNGTGM